jgi:hypothetical protein
MKKVTVEWTETLHRAAVVFLDDDMADDILDWDEEKTISFVEEVGEDVGYEEELECVQVDDDDRE